MVKTEEAAHGRRVEKRRGGEGGGGVVLVPHAGGQIPNMTVLQVCCISNCPYLRMYQMCRR